MDRHVKDTWTVFKIMGEFVEGFETLRSAWPAVSIFGGARVGRGSPAYADAMRMASSLGEAGFNVITGGGPGLMEAANRGAESTPGKSIGLNIKLPAEQGINDYTDIDVEFNYFFARKVMFVKYACGIVGLPGGYGTLDEIFECLTLVQTKKVKEMPVVLFGSRFWGGLVEWLEDQPLGDRMLRKRDMKLFNVTDDVEEATDIIRRHHQHLMKVTHDDMSEGRQIP
jgi:uncharacterized protein (TIGR00730 family)